MIVYFLMIIGFSYFYATIQFNPMEISNNLKKNGGFIPGFRPGKPTVRLHRRRFSTRSPCSAPSIWVLWPSCP